MPKRGAYGQIHMSSGRYRSRVVCGSSDLKASFALRHAAFFGAAGLDTDGFDAACHHVLIEDHETAELVCSFRILLLEDGAELNQSYSYQYYELTRLTSYSSRMMEVGRFCVLPGLLDPDVLRFAWAIMAAIVDVLDVKMLFGCTSFAGTQIAPYNKSFGLLRDRYLAPLEWSPGIKAPFVHEFDTHCDHQTDIRHAMRVMPPLLRTYLMMGGWVSDHVVIDKKMNTLHVFTGLEVSIIPEGRKQLLRAVPLRT